MADDRDIAARNYLDRALKEAGIEMKAASQAAGKNHAYIQQYIKTGKPRWLSETVREALLQAYPFLDGSKLKPPPPVLRQQQPPSRRQRHHQAQIYPQRYGQFVDDPSTLQLLDFWNQITDPTRRELAVRILRTLAADQNSAVVA